MIYEVRISKKAKKDLVRIPDFIIEKLKAWILTVEELGLENVRKIPGYHDEPLQGKRLGQRSVRLSLSYRAIYVVAKQGFLEFVNIEKVSKHDY